MHNALHSSGFVLTIHGVSSEELDARAQSAWEIIRSIVNSEGWFPADDNLQQFNDLLTEALTTQSADVDQVYDEAASLIKGNWPTLEEARDLALQKAMADAEIDRLGREARHVQLTEALSTPRYAAAGAHWRKALDFATADPVDHPNAIKEAVASLEALSQVVIGKT